jgi:hypothetical protein
MKRLALVAAVVALLAPIATASATITTSTAAFPPSTPFSTYYQVLTPYHCAGPSTISLSDSRPVLLKFGWFVSQPSQLSPFFKNEHGSYTITGLDSTNASESFTDSWSETSGAPAVSTQGVSWSPAFASTISPNGTTQVNGYASFFYALLTFTATGTYNFSMSWTLDHSIYDGFSSAPKGTSSFNCNFTVVS